MADTLKSLVFKKIDISDPHALGIVQGVVTLDDAVVMVVPCGVKGFFNSIPPVISQATLQIATGTQQVACWLTSSNASAISIQALGMGIGSSYNYAFMGVAF